MIGTPIDLAQPLRLHRPIALVQVHHTAGSELDTPEQVEAHALARGVGFREDPYQIHIWRGPDQGVGINAWLISWGRDPEEVPAGVDGHNGAAIAVAVHGDYSKGPLPGYARERLIEVLRWLLASLSLGVDAVRGHGEIEPTLCPGFDMDEIRGALHAGK